jgi:threonylcarbamoyladenosine tRNA methylthiotransferase MtaB
MPDQIPAQIAKERAARLRAWARRKPAYLPRRFIGRELDVVVEAGEGAMRKGLTRHYLTVSFAGDEELVGKSARVKVTGFRDAGFEGHLI